MSVFPDYIIREIADKNDIYDVVSQTVSLKKAGSSYIGLCPFHNEKTPSFSVSSKRGIFKCFGCGEGGDVIGFVMKNENLSFVEAVQKLAKRANIQLPEFKDYDADKAQKRKEKTEKLYAVNRDAAEFFYSNVKSSPAIIEYFKKRQITGSMVKTFWLGYAPDSWTSLFDHLKSKGYTESDIFDAGLIQKHDTGRYYDFFRNRLTITIFDANSNVIGFSARVLDNSLPKYINTRETSVFSKQKNLYGLNIARKSKQSYCILCEGCMDAISLMSYGYTNTVAPLGTSFTEEQAKQLSRYFEEVVICFDSDNAGRKATARAITILRAFPNLKITVLDLKARKDPDEFIKEYGVERFHSLLCARKRDMEYLIGHFEEQYNLKLSDGKIGFISSMASYLSLISSTVELDVYANMISALTGVQASSILAQAGLKKAENVKGLPGNADFINVVNKGSAVTDDNQYLERTRALLVSTLFYDTRAFSKYKDQIDETLFTSPIHKLIYSYIKECHQKGETVSQSSLLSRFNTKEDVNSVSGILALDVQSEDNDKAVSDYINQIKQKSYSENAIKLFEEGKISLEEFNNIINNKG